VAAQPGKGKAGPRPNILFVIADDWSWPHAGIYGDRVVKTPHFDKLARQGIVFHNAHCVSPSCTPSRGAILTGQWIHRLQEGGNLHGILPGRYAVYPDLLEAVGYFIGLTGKGWGPGVLDNSGRTRNPAGPRYKSFAAFLKALPPGRPFCFWYGSTDPHRPYELGSGAKAGMKAEGVKVPPYWPDTPKVRSDVLDYYVEVQRFDEQLGELLRLLAEAGLAENTLVIVTSDNGMPFPRCKANLYGGGTHMPLAIRWPARFQGRVGSAAFVSHSDFAPTILEAAGVKIPKEMTGRSFLGMLKGEAGRFPDREMIFLERERHANVRKGDLSYPARAVRTAEYLYIRNLRPDRWPAGDPQMHVAVGPFGDIDDGPTKREVMALRDAPPAQRRLFELCCGKRPAEELYDLKKDPHEIDNVADHPDYAKVKARLRAALDQWMADTGDPRAEKGGGDDRWDQFPYYGKPGKKKQALLRSRLVEPFVLDVGLDGPRYEVADRATRSGPAAQVAAGDVDEGCLDTLQPQRGLCRQLQGSPQLFGRDERPAWPRDDEQRRQTHDPRRLVPVGEILQRVRADRQE
jgi:arylsulfatase A-like enzyme